MSAASFGFVSLLLLAAALPAASGLSASAVVSAPAAELPAQAFVNLSEASNGPVSRDAYGVTTRAELLRQQYTLTYTTTWSGPIRWPFPTPVRISSDFGYRPPPCSGCSSYHGQTVVSSDAHMQRGSSPLVAGQVVKVGEFVGLVGATGQVTGAHLHLEIDVDGQKVDPFAWLSANAG